MNNKTTYKMIETFEGFRTVEVLGPTFNGKTLRTGQTWIKYSDGYVYDSEESYLLTFEQVVEIRDRTRDLVGVRG